MANPKINDIKSFVEAAKAKPKALQFGGSQSKDTDQILVSTIADTPGRNSATSRSRAAARQSFSSLADTSMPM